MTEKAMLRTLFDKAVEVADPMQSLHEYLPSKPAGRVFVVGAGKASARMAEAVEKAWGPCEGLVITRYGYARPCQGIEVIEAAHPVPDQAGLQATQSLLEHVKELTENDYVLALISGGASALMIAPADGISLEEKQAINTALLASGAPIDQMNIVRKHLSQIKGGQLATAVYPATLRALLISDVSGDKIEYIGSGPTSGDDSSPVDALNILQRYKIDIPASVKTHLLQGSGVVPKDDKRLERVENIIYAAPSHSIKAAADLAKSQGYTVKVLGDEIDGEAREVAKEQAALAQSIQAGLTPEDNPVLLLSGGELTVTRQGQGIGGPNAEYCLSLAIALDAAPGIFAIACDTDGVDGAAEVAGALVGPDTLHKAEVAGNDPLTALANNDAHTFFEQIGEQVITGPTLTNVNDFRAILIQPL
ncbi:glycerate kinase [Neptunomonas phycophila]|uniref:glycerate kinase type-2 family protein n=1 Tax=Neptunomonas phycophila TaxID=1572645 RepID=UPI0026E2EECD|nr:glycerate kinase [Neptunomonas phycophila]MDO6468689.1 glycerate kinase [Neptunomonas phycophila]